MRGHRNPTVGFDLGLRDYRLFDKVPERAAPTIIPSAHAGDDSPDAKAPQKMDKKLEAPFRRLIMPRSLPSTVRSLNVDHAPDLPYEADPVLDILRKLFMSQIWWSRMEKTLEQPTFTVTRDSVVSSAPSDNVTADLPRAYGTYVITKHYLPIEFGPENFRRAKITAKLDDSGAGVLIKPASASTSDSTTTSGWLTPNAFVDLFGPTPASDSRGIGSPHWHTSTIWATSGKHFDLLKLPRELRDAVYAACCTPACYPCYMYKGGWEYLPRRRPTLLTSDISRHMDRIYGGCFRATDNAPRATVAPVLSLLLANKQVSREFEDVLLRECEFFFADTHAIAHSRVLFGKELLKRTPFVSFLRLKDGISTVRTLTKLRLDLDTLTWLKVLDLQEVLTESWSGRWSHECLAAGWLAEMRGLKQFTAFLGHKNVKTTRQTTYNRSLRCHRFCTGLILLGLAGLMAGVKKVRVLGCVSEQLRGMFMRFLREGGNDDGDALMWDILGWDGRRHEALPNPPIRDFAQVKLSFPREKELAIP